MQLFSQEISIADAWEAPKHTSGTRDLKNVWNKSKPLKAYRCLKNGTSKSIVHVIKHANFELYGVHPDGVI